MGTRHLIGVVLDGDWKIAQYGQWDGYFDGQGADVHRFLNRGDLDLGLFRDQVRKLRWVSDEETAAIEADPQWSVSRPWMSRDFSAQILDAVYADQVPYVGDGSEFGWDGLFCEYAYVIDLDKMNLEIYTGFHQSPAPDGRWPGEVPAGIDKVGGKEYYGVHLIKTYNLEQLPTDLDAFLEELGEAEAAHGRKLEVGA